MIKLCHTECLPASVNQKILQFAIPFAIGDLQDPTKLCLRLNNNPLTTQVKITARWPDNSIRWAVITAHTPEGIKDPDELVLDVDAAHRATAPVVAINDFPDYLLLQQGSSIHRICKKTATIHTFLKSQPETPSWSTFFSIKDRHNKTLIPCVDTVKVVSVTDSVFPVISIAGNWHSETKLHFTLELYFYPEGQLKITYKVHHTGRAIHPSGMWDLGDPGSVLFTCLQLHVEGEATTWGLQPKVNSNIINSNQQPIVLAQHSSAGSNWQSQNHIDKNGQITTKAYGFSINGNFSNRESNEPDAARAEPTAYAVNKIIATIAVPRFWQKFPQAISTKNNGIVVSLFPDQAPYLHELQGGEKSTREIWLAFSDAITPHSTNAILENLQWVYQPVRIIVPATYIEQCQVMAWFTPGQKDNLAKCILPPDNFFAKREIIDEYGWRNFGDIYADHETLYQASHETPYISHYNNQYDAIYGFCRQYLLTGDSKWFELMDDLANHVTDIDIYDTDEDRDEYNHGLFWHTDHYLPARTATHRTYSKLNTLNGLNTSGGGPGPEHCYTTGLCYHYWLTGNEASKQAVIKLTDWITAYHEGSKSFLAQLFAIKNHELPRLRQLLKGEKLLAHTYPFTRGTGNYLTALIDSYLLTQEQTYLKRAEKIIEHVIHPADDIAARELLNVEVSWSYLICLSSIIRYLEVKITIRQFDSHYAYAKASILHYARWIRDHEQAFLAHPEKLEFPNDTWTAQDIRKAMLLFQASSLSEKETEKSSFHDSAEDWLTTVAHQLQASNTLYFARIQIILLQNHGPHIVSKRQLAAAFVNKENLSPLAYTSIYREIIKIIVKSVKALRHLNLKKEKAWLKTRLNIQQKRN